MKLSLLCFIFGLSVLAHGEATAIDAKDLTPTGSGGGKQPQVAVAPDGTIYVVFGKDTSVYVTSSTDHGATFSAPVQVADVPKLMLGMRRGPRIAATSDRILVSAPNSGLQTFLSTDHGKTWSPIGTMNDRSTGAEEGLQNITALPDGSFYAVWLDHRTGSQQIEGARLDPTATAWGKNVTVYQSPERSVCECCHPSVVSDEKGKLSVMWRNSLGGNRDFYLAESMDRGDTFSEAAKLGTGSWQIAGCPMDGGGLIAKSDAGIWTIWRRQDDVFLDQPGKPETKIGRGMQPVITMISGEIYCVWQKTGYVYIAKNSGKTQVGMLPGGEASVIASPDGKEAYLVWEGSEGADMVPKFAVLR